MPISVMLHNADKALCPGPKPRPKPPKPAPVPCNCPPRTYRNPPDVIVEAGDNIKVDATEAQDITTYTVSAIPVPVKVDPETMYGDGIVEPIGVYEYDGDAPGLVPEAPADSKEKKFLQADGTWVFVDFPVDQALDPASPNAVANGAVCGGLSALNEKIENHPSYLIVETNDEGYPDVETPSEVYLYLTKINSNKIDNYKEWIWHVDAGWECIGETSADPYAADEEHGLHLDDDTLTFSMKLKTTEEGEVDTDNGGLNFDKDGNLYNSNMSRACTDEEMESWLAYDYLVDPPTSENDGNDESDEDEDNDNG